ncbi:MAG: hypothetical protein AAFO91_12095 [Bacteroidota bacterium]
MSEIWIIDKDIAGHLAMWVLRQSPYNSVDGVAEATAAIIRAAEKDDAFSDMAGVNMRTFEGSRELEDWLREALSDTSEVLERWNTPKIESEAPFLAVTRYDRNEPDTDFIDIDALLRNAARSCWFEMYMDSQDNKGIWATVFEAAYGFLPLSKRPA